MQCRGSKGDFLLGWRQKHDYDLKLSELMAKFSCRFMIHTSVSCLVLSNICKAGIIRLGFFSLYEGSLEGSPHSNIIIFFCAVQLTRPKQSQNKRVKIADWGKGGFERVEYIPILSY